jgi:hypothetical protein
MLITKEDSIIYMGTKWRINKYVEILAINKIYKISPSVYFVSEGQVAQSSAVIFGQFVIYRNLSLV